MPQSRPPTSDGPNIACPIQETPSATNGKNGLSTSLPKHLRTQKADTPRAYGYGPCSRHPSISVRSRHRIFEQEGHGIALEGHPSISYSDTWSTKLYDNSNYLSNGNSYGNPTFGKSKIFIETKVTAMKLQGFNL